MTAFWPRWRAVWRARLQQQITRAGMVYIAAILLVALASFASSNNLLFLILAAMLSTFLISGFVSRLMLAGLELELLLPQHTVARRKVRASVRLKNLKRWVPSFSVQLAFRTRPGEGGEFGLYFPVIGGGAMVEEPVELYFPRRGAHRERAFIFSTFFPFGFVERTENVVVRQDVIVYPCLDPRPELRSLLDSVTGEVEAMHRGQGSDFYRIRPYEYSESARHVDWKATAHTGDLKVREFVRERDSSVVIYLDLAIPVGKEDWFESAVESAAYLAFELTIKGVRVRLITQERDVTTVDPGDIYTMLKYLALVSPRAAKPQVVSDDTNSYQIVLSLNADVVAANGWRIQQRSCGRLLGEDFATGHPQMVGE